MKREAYESPWERYALILELTHRVCHLQQQFGKTALQKLIFLLQTVYKIDCDYDFSLYSYGPFDAEILNDLDIVEHWGAVLVKNIKTGIGGYQILLTNNQDIQHTIREKADAFLNDSKTQRALDELIKTYGKMTARDLELRATTVYVAQELETTEESRCTEDGVTELVSEIKPRFPVSEIRSVVQELQSRQHIQLKG